MRKMPLLLTLSITLLIGIGCSGIMPGQSEPLTFTIEFKDAEGLRVGNSVRYRGLDIGAVTNVGLASGDTPVQVSVAIDEPCRNEIRTDSDFIIRNRALVSVDNQKQVQAIVWDRNSPPLEHGVTVKGLGNLSELWLKQIERWGEQGFLLGELTMQTEFRSDGSTARAFVLETGKLLPSELLLDDLLPQGPAWQVNRPPSEDVRTLRVSGHFTSIEDMVWVRPDLSSEVTSTVSPSQTVSTKAWTRSDVSFEIVHSAFSTDYVYRETFQPGRFAVPLKRMSVEELLTQLATWAEELVAGDRETLAITLEVLEVLQTQLKAQMVPLDRVGANLTLQMPGEIVESNAQFAAGNQCAWTASVADLDGGFEVYARSRETNMRNVGLVGGGGLLMLLLVAGGGLIAWGRTREKKRGGEVEAYIGVEEEGFDEYDVADADYEDWHSEEEYDSDYTYDD